jgi:hypothetical protein
LVFLAGVGGEDGMARRGGWRRTLTISLLNIFLHSFYRLFYLLLSKMVDGAGVLKDIREPS